LIKVKSKCWQIDKKLLAESSDYFNTAFRQDPSQTQFELQDIDSSAFVTFVSWLYNWDKKQQRAYLDPFVSSPLPVSDSADAWFVADKLGATAFGRFALECFVRAVSFEGSFKKYRKGVCKAVARVIETRTLDPALERFGRQWVRWCIDKDLEIVKTFPSAGLRGFGDPDPEKATPVIYDPRLYDFDHWFQECSRAPSAAPTCLHVNQQNSGQLPVMTPRVRKVKRDYYGEVRDWANLSLPKLSAKNIAGIICVGIQLALGVSMIALASLLVAHGLQGVRWTTSTYSLFVACLTIAAAPFPVAAIPGFFALWGGIASAVDTVTCKSVS
jgi:hypothetical protein